MSDDENSKASDCESWRTDNTVEALSIEKPTSLAERWKRLLLSGEWCDCSFKVGTEDENPMTFDCHGLVLASCSPVFGAMLLGPLAEKQFPILIPDVSSTAFSYLLKFAYTGEVQDCAFSLAVEVCKAADKYQVDGLLEAYIDLLCDKLEPDYVCDAFQLADLLNLKKLKEFSIRMLQDQTSQVLASPSFIDMPAEFVHLLVLQDQLCVSEQQLADSVMQWAVARLDGKQEDQEKSIIVTEPNDTVESSENSSPETMKLSAAVTGNHNLRKRQSKCVSNLNTKKICSSRKIIIKTPSPPASNLVENDTARKGKDLREILGPVIKHIRFLAPSLNLDEFVTNYPQVLTELEESEIKKSREDYQHQLANLKGRIHGPFNENATEEYSKFEEWENIQDIKNIQKKQDLSPLPSSLHNKFAERNIIKQNRYKNLGGENVDFKFAPLVVCNRQAARILKGKNFNFLLSSNQVLRWYGVRIPSQMSPAKFSPSTLTYREHIYIDVKQCDGLGSGMPMYSHYQDGRVEFDNIVPYNSMIDIWFPTPFEVYGKYEALVEVEFCVDGSYPRLHENFISSCGVTKINIRDCYSGENEDYSFIQGIIFETRSKVENSISQYWKQTASESDDSVHDFPISDYDFEEEEEEDSDYS